VKQGRVVVERSGASPTKQNNIYFIIFFQENTNSFLRKKTNLNSLKISQLAVSKYIIQQSLANPDNQLFISCTLCISINKVLFEKIKKLVTRELKNQTNIVVLRPKKKKTFLLQQK